MKFLAFVLLMLALILEASLTTIPLVFLVLLCLLVILGKIGYSFLHLFLGWCWI